ncbi:MAG: tetratricopeptide repeat protein [Anaerolineaceae bacterium]
MLDIVNVTEADFEYEVVNYSQNIPVVVDFWATWCIPCKVVSPILEKIAVEADGAFRLAKIDVDENPKLARMLNVRTVPAVKAFRNGQIIAEFTGALDETKVREFFQQILPTENDLILEKANSLLRMHQWASAEKTFRQALAADPQSPQVLLGLAKSLLAQGQPQESLEILRRFPASREYSSAETLRPLAEAMTTHTALPDEEDLLAPAYQNSLRLASRGNIPSAIDGLLDILRTNKHYLNDQPRQVVLALLSLLGEEDPQTRTYRAELASILF